MDRIRSFVKKSFALPAAALRRTLSTAGLLVLVVMLAALLALLAVAALVAGPLAVIGLSLLPRRGATSEPRRVSAASVARMVAAVGLPGRGVREAEATG